MKKNTKKKIDKAIGITILVVIGLFVGRYFLSDVAEYRKIEAKVSDALNIPEITEKVVDTLGLGEDKSRIEALQQQREAALEREERPTFNIECPLGEAKKTKTEYKVTPLIDKAYYPALKSVLRKAKKSIYVAMFVIKIGDSPTDPVNVLLNELIAAQKRGVDVKVVVDQPGKETSSLYKTNEKAIEYLERGKVDARFDHPRFENHDKFVLIDEKILIVGNHNWSKQALTVNKEASVMIEALSGDQEYVRHFSTIQLAKPEETKKGRLAMIKELQKKLLKRTQSKG